MSEIRRVADLTAAFQRSFTPHDCRDRPAANGRHERSTPHMIVSKG